jgi:hypothetical protein
MVDQLKLVVEDELEMFLAIYEKIIDSPISEKAYIEDSLEKFSKLSEFKKLHIKSAELCNSYRYEESYEFVAKQISKINDISFKNDKHITSKEIDDTLKRYEEKKFEEISIMGVDQLPDYGGKKSWNGKIPKGSVTTVIGSYNTGKTAFMINCAMLIASCGHRVLFIFHEGRKEQIILRFLSRITLIPYNVLKVGLLDEDQKQRVEMAKEFIENFIRIREMRNVGNTVEDVVLYAKQTMKEWPFDCLIDDYGQKLMPKRVYSELRHNQKQVWDTLDSMSGELNIAVMTAAQLNREYSKKNKKGIEIIRSEGISEAISIAHISETILTLNRSAKDGVEDKLVICLDKSRDENNGLLIQCRTNMSALITHDPDLGYDIIGYDIATAEDDGDKRKK